MNEAKGEKTVLIIDDISRAWDIFSQRLTLEAYKSGISVNLAHAQSPLAEATRALLDRPDVLKQVHLIMVENTFGAIPGNGVEFVRQLREVESQNHLPPTPVFLYSGNAIEGQALSSDNATKLGDQDPLSFEKENLPWMVTQLGGTLVQSSEHQGIGLDARLQQRGNAGRG